MLVAGVHVHRVTSVSGFRVVLSLDLASRSLDRETDLRRVHLSALSSVPCYHHPKHERRQREDGSVDRIGNLFHADS